MAKYRLLAKHYMYDQLLEEGTVVGDDTSFKIPPEMVTPDMEGLDDESKAKVKEVQDRIADISLPTAPQQGLLYLEPDVKEALKKSLGAPTPTPTPTAKPAPVSAPVTKEK